MSRAQETLHWPARLSWIAAAGALVCVGWATGSVLREISALKLPAKSARPARTSSEAQKVVNRASEEIRQYASIALFATLIALPLALWPASAALLREDRTRRKLQQTARDNERLRSEMAETKLALSETSAHSTELERRIGEFKKNTSQAIAEMMEAGQQRDTQNRLLSEAVENATDVVIITDAPASGQDARVLYVNRAFTKMTGYSENEIQGKSPRLLQGARTDLSQVERVRRSLRNFQPVLVELLNYRKDGTEFWVELNIHPVRDSRGNCTHWISIQRDVSERREMHRRLYHQARHDALTALPNRYLFLERLEVAIAQAEQDKMVVGILFCDLDRFKKINDTLGHMAGDRLLQEVSRRIRRQLRPQDTLARMGGDEFTIILPGLPDRENAVEMARGLLEALRAPFLVDGRELFITASIGLSIAPDDGTDMEGLLRAADDAMYQVKEDGRAGYRVYTHAQDRWDLERLDLESHLAKALEKNELSLAFQPQVDTVTGAVFGAELLLRWESEALGRVSPAIFIPVAEETGLIDSIGHWIFDQACRQLQSWIFQGLFPQLAVNLSARQLVQNDLPKTLGNLLRQYDIPPHLMDLELTERVLIKNESAGDTLRALKKLGVRLSVDDFGTGYSSLSYLRHMPLDILKIDKSFVDGLGDDRKSEVLVRSVIELSHGVGLQVIAEGVETELQRCLLEKLGCEGIQGYLVSRPVSVAEFEALYRANPAPLDRDNPLKLSLAHDPLANFQKPAVPVFDEVPAPRPPRTTRSAKKVSPIEIIEPSPETVPEIAAALPDDLSPDDDFPSEPELTLISDPPAKKPRSRVSKRAG